MKVTIALCIAVAFAITLRSMPVIAQNPAGGAHDDSRLQAFTKANHLAESYNMLLKRLEKSKLRLGENQNDQASQADARYTIARAIVFALSVKSDGEEAKFLPDDFKRQIEKCRLIGDGYAESMKLKLTHESDLQTIVTASQNVNPVRLSSTLDALLSELHAIDIDAIPFPKL